MKKVFSVTLVVYALSLGCSSGSGDKQTSGSDSAATTVSANDSLDAQLKKAEDLVKDDTTTLQEDNF